MSESAYPQWPTPAFKTRGDAIAAAMLDLDPGDEVEVHAETCAWRFNLDCDCTPQVLVVPDRGLA